MSTVVMHNVVSVDGYPAEAAAVAVQDDAHRQVSDFKRSGAVCAAAIPMPCASPMNSGGHDSMVAITAGRHFSLALCSDGTVAGWGDNSSGQLGDNTLTVDGGNFLKPLPALL